MKATTVIRNLSASSAVLALMAYGTPVLAQAAPPAPAAPMAQPADQGGAGEIIVTAQRKAENQQNVPIAITAFSQRMLEAKSIYSSYDLNKAVPGLATVSDQANGALPQFSIRGRGQSYGAASGSVETYFADVPLSPPFEAPGLPPQFFDLQSAQVLKGPQGTLFGRNSTGGAVLFVPAPAVLGKTDGYVRVQGGNYANVQAEGAFNIPIGDTAALRVAGFEWHRKGYAKTIAGSIDPFGNVLPSQDVNNQDVTEVRATLLWKVTDKLTNSTIATYHRDNNRGTLQAQYYANPDKGGVTQPPVPAGVVTPGVTPTSFYNNVNLEHQPTQTWAVINTTSYELADNLTLKNIFAHISAAGVTSQPSDYDGSGKNGAIYPAGSNTGDLETGLASLRVNHNYQTTDEIQLQGHAFDNKLDFIVGGLLDITRQPGGVNDINFAQVTYSNPFIGTPFNNPLPINENFIQDNYTSESGFGSITYHIADTLSFIAGFRHIWDNITQNSYSTFVANITSAVPPGNKEVFNNKKFQGSTYNFGLEYKPSSDTMIYGGYRRGYKRGGFNTQVLVPGQGAFKPETDKDFYLGLKQNLRVFGVPGHFNIEGFNDIYYNAQRYFLGSDGLHLETVVVNAEKSTFRGFDLDVTLDPTKWLSLSGNYTLVDSKYNKFSDQSEPPEVFAALGNPSNDLSHNPVGLVSRNKFSITARLHTELADGGELAFAPSFNYQSKFYADDYSVRIPLSDALIGGGFTGVGQINLGAHGLDTVPGYSTIDLRAEWNKIHGSNFDLGINVNNLTNKTYILTVNGLYNFGVQAAIYGPPRLETVELRYHF